MATELLTYSWASWLEWVPATRERIHPVLPRTWERNDESQIVPVPLLPLWRGQQSEQNLFYDFITTTCATRLTLLKLTNMEISCSMSFSGYISLVHAHPKRNGCHNDGRLSSPQLQRLSSNDATWNSFVSGNTTSTVVALRNFKLMIPGIESYMIFTCLNLDVSFSCWHPTVHHGGTLRGCGTAALWWAATWAW